MIELLVIQLSIYAAIKYRSSCGPTASIFPLARTIILSADNTVENRCAIMKVVRPFIRFVSASLTRFSDFESSEEVASSRISILGFRRIALAMAILCFSPPDNFVPLSPTGSLISGGQSHDELVCVRCFCSFYNFCLRGSQVSISYVFIDDCTKEKCILQDNSELG